MGYDAICSFDLESCLKKLGLKEKGRVQQVVTHEILKNIEPFIPFDAAEKYENPGKLIDSGHIEDESDIVWNTPYARKHYYHPKQNFQEKGESENGGPGRGAYWADRYLQNGGKIEIEQAARKAARK